MAHGFASIDKSWGEEGEVVGTAPDERFLFCNGYWAGGEFISQSTVQEGWWDQVVTGLAVGLGGSGGKGEGEEEENMGQSTISEKILIHLICILSE